MKSALKRKSPDRELENPYKGKKDLRVNERDALEKRRLRAERKAAGSPDYQVDIFTDLEQGLPPILEEMEDNEVTGLLAETLPLSQSPPSRSEERSMVEEEWKTVQKRATPRQVPQGEQGEGKGRNEPARNDEKRGFKIPKKSDANNRRSGNDGNRERNGSNIPPPLPGALAPMLVPLQQLLLSWSYGFTRARPRRCPSFSKLSPPFKRLWPRHWRKKSVMAPLGLEVWSDLTKSHTTRN
jgi:hypothetical protein